jgi:hypothetical protein
MDTYRLPVAIRPGHASPRIVGPAVAVHELVHLVGARREAALVRALLQELEQLTGDASRQLSEQLAEELAVLAHRLLEASAAISACAQAVPSSPEGPPTRPNAGAR